MEGLFGSLSQFDGTKYGRAKAEFSRLGSGRMGTGVSTLESKVRF